MSAALTTTGFADRCQRWLDLDVERSSGVEPDLSEWRSEAVTVWTIAWSGVPNLHRHLMVGSHQSCYWTNPAIGGAMGLTPIPYGRRPYR